VHREQEELYLVLEGRLRVEAGGETFEIGPREALVVPAGVPHQLWNAGEDDVTYIAVAAPPAPGDSSPA
jgi:mannose-6-phosphate isomerase-like protein (cupin superfamily)